MCLQGVCERLGILLPILHVLHWDPSCLTPIFKDIQIINIYEANGFPADNWESELENKREAWIITRLHYNKDGCRQAIRKTSRDRSWNARWGRRKKTPKDYPNCNCLQELKDLSWIEELYYLKVRGSKSGNKLPEYTMHEFTPDTYDKMPKYALCKITRRSKKEAEQRQLLQKRPGASNNRNIRKFLKGETSRSRECIQQGGDTEYSRGPHKIARDQWDTLQIDAEVPHELAQFCSESELKQMMVEIKSNENDGSLNEVLVKYGCGALLMPPTAVPQNAITIHPSPGLSNSQDIASPYGYNNTSIQAYNQSPCILDNPSADHGLLPDWNLTIMEQSSLGLIENKLIGPQQTAITECSIYTAPPRTMEAEIAPCRITPFTIPSPLFLTTSDHLERGTQMQWNRGHSDSFQPNSSMLEAYNTYDYAP